MMKRLKICCFLGLALLLLTLPVRGAELPPEVERALPREAGQLLKDVDHWDVNSFSEGLCAIWNHLRKDVNTVLRRQTRGRYQCCWWRCYADWSAAFKRVWETRAGFCLWRVGWPSPL